MRVVVVLVVVVVAVTGGKQSQLLVRLTWTGMDLDLSLTKVILINTRSIRSQVRLEEGYSNNRVISVQLT